jgi:competence protein ComEC
MKLSTKVLICLLLFLLGVYLAPFLHGKMSIYVPMVIFCLSLLLFCVFRRYCFLAVLFLLGGLFRMLIAIPNFDADHIASLNELDEKMKVEAAVTGEPEMRGSAQYLELEARGSLHGKILAKINKFPEYEYGDVLSMEGYFKQPADFDGFSYSDFLAKENIYSVIYYPYIKKISGGGWDGWSSVFYIKNWVQSVIDTIFPEPLASLSAGVLLGFRRGIPDSTMNDFNIAGLTHILAISGYNITIIITVFGLILKGFRKDLRIILIIVGIIFFAFITGLSASVIRASIMGSLTVTALHFGKRSLPINSLFLSAVIMVMINPFILMSDISFQLSFMSTFGLIVLLPLWEKSIGRLPVIVRENLMVTLAAQVFTTPLILYYFGRFSIIAPFANVIFLPLIPLLMFFSFAAIGASLILYPLSVVFTAIAWLISEILLKGVHLIALIPCASLEVNFFNEYFLIGTYLLIAAVIFYKSRLAQA